MLILFGIIVLALWFLGFLVHIGGGFIHLLLIIGIILLLSHLMRGRRHPSNY